MPENPPDSARVTKPAVTRREAVRTAFKISTAAMLAPALISGTESAAAASAEGGEGTAVPYVDGQIPGTPGPGETVGAYGAKMPKAKIGPLRITRRPVGAKDVQVDLLWTGICHTDMHFVDNDSKMSVYPCVPGHEMVGRVSAVGKGVSRHEVGDLVAIGPIVGNCGKCPACQADAEQYCVGPSMTHAYNGPIVPNGTNTYGGYSARTVVGEEFAFKVPANLDPKTVAPILCAGLTTYSPLKHWGAGPGKKVGIVGLGGLGHMAVQIGAAMGAEITVFSLSPEKEADAMKFGAKAFVIHKDPAAMEKQKAKFDLVINTIPEAHDVNPLINLIRRDGTLVNLGHLGPLATPTNNALVAFQRRSLSGSFIGSLAESQELLNFCGRKNIASSVETIKLAEVNEAYPRIKAGKVRYRYVIDVAGSFA